MGILSKFFKKAPTEETPYRHFKKAPETNERMPDPYDLKPSPLSRSEQFGRIGGIAKEGMLGARGILDSFGAGYAKGKKEAAGQGGHRRARKRAHSAGRALGGFDGMFADDFALLGIEPKKNVLGIEPKKNEKKKKGRTIHVHIHED